MRVSKADDSQNPTNQREPLLNLAKSQSLEVVKEYVDKASGGSSNRPAFQRMLRDAKNGEFSMVLVWSLDRFSREGIRNTLSYLETLKRASVGLKSLSEGWLDTSDEGIGQLLISILSWVAEQERIRISQRTKAGLKVAKANGRLLGRRNGAKDKRKRSNGGYLRRWDKVRTEKLCPTN